MRSGRLHQRMRRRYGPRKSTVAWGLRLLVAGAILLFIWYRPRHQTESKKSAPRRCKFPELDMNHTEVLRHFDLAMPLSCTGQSGDWVCVQGSTASLCNHTRDGRALPVTCGYDFLSAAGVISETVEVTGHRKVQLKSDVFWVHCHALYNGAEETWTSKMAGVAAKQEILGRRDSLASGQSSGRLVNASVLLWDIGPMSRMTFMRKLPKTYEFLVDKLRGYVFTGYNTIGTAGHGALFPILTGSATQDGAWSTMDRPEFVWSAYKRRGYVTALVLDDATSGIPLEDVDHHLGLFYEHLAKEGDKHKQFCYGAKAKHEVVMDWIVDFFDVYSNNPKLAILAHRELAENKVVELSDEQNVRFLQKLLDKGHLDNTVLIVLSDSGPSAGSYGTSQQAKMEERLPFLSIAIPLSMETDFPESATSLQMNTEKLVTQMDIHATMINLLDLVDFRMGKRSQRAISLFAEVPGHRSCEEASIPTPFCTCLMSIAVNTEGRFVRRAIDHLVDFMNARTEEFRSTCARLELVRVESCRMYFPNSELLGGQKVQSWGQVFFSSYFDVHLAEEEVYHVTMVTDPGNWKLGAYFRYMVDEDQFRFDQRWIYRDQSSDTKDCVPLGTDELRVICQCQTEP